MDSSYSLGRTVDDFLGIFSGQQGTHFLGESFKIFFVSHHFHSTHTAATVFNAEFTRPYYKLQLHVLFRCFFIVIIEVSVALN